MVFLYTYHWGAINTYHYRFIVNSYYINFIRLIHGFVLYCVFFSMYVLDIGIIIFTLPYGRCCKHVQYMHVVIGKIHCMSCYTFRLYIHFVFSYRNSTSFLLLLFHCLNVGNSTYNGWIFSKKFETNIFFSLIFIMGLVSTH